FNSDKVVPNHVYAMVGYASGTFTMFNPWGVDGGYDSTGKYFPGFFTGDAKSMATNFGYWRQETVSAAQASTAEIASAVATGLSITQPTLTGAAGEASMPNVVAPQAGEKMSRTDAASIVDSQPTAGRTVIGDAAVDAELEAALAEIFDAA